MTAKNDSKKLNAMFSCLQGIFWICFCVSISFVVPLMITRGFTAWERSIVLVMMGIGAAAAQPVFGYLCDKFASYRLIYFCSTAVGFLCYCALNFIENKFAVSLILLVVNICLRSMNGLVDSWISKLSQNGYQINYGVARGFGSFAFAITAAVYGTVMDHFGIRLTPFILLAALIAVFFLGMRLPQPEKVSKSTHISMKSAFSEFVHHPKFHIFALCEFLVYLSVACFNFLFPVVIRELGGSDSHLGIALFIMAILEIPVMFAFSRIKARFNPLGIMSFAIFFFGLKSVLVGLSPNVGTAYLACTLQFFSWGLMVPCLVYFVSEEIPYQFAATALLVMNTVSRLGDMTGNMSIGAVADGMSGGHLLALTAAPAFVSAAILFIASRYYYHSRKKNS